MWNKFSIKIQLIIIISLVVVAVEAATMFFVLKIQKEENNKNAIIESKAITKSLNNDLVKYILNPSADLLSDISFRLKAFKNIKSMIVFDESNNAIYKYGNIEKDIANKYLKTSNTFFTKESLYIKNNLVIDNYNFGYTILDVDLTSFKMRQEQITNTILAIFPFALIFGSFLAMFFSKTYTKPFLNLLEAMKKSDPTKNDIKYIKTNASNEIKDIFQGFNKQMEQISNASKKLQFQANHDQLTGIYNRFYMDKALQETLKEENNTKGNNVFLIDLDQFKLINDSVGNEAGDNLLKMLVNHYKQILPKDALFGRIDGDSFSVLIKNTSKEFGEQFLQKSLEALSDFRFSHNNETYSVSASISMVHFKAFEFTLNELLKAISVSLYTAKQKGRNKSHIYDKSDEKTKQVSIEIDTAKKIKEALGNGPARFELFAQDIVPLQYESDKIGYEILIRMWDKDNNFISPDQFLGTAERYQLMSAIDSFVLWTYLETVTKDKNHINKLHSAHINLAGSSLNNPDFQAKVKEAIEYFDFPWEKLELEITESSAIGSFNMANEFISYLKSKKIGLALDDFGTGMASFEYLKSMPFDVVKIDGSFVKDMHNDPTDKAVIKYIQEIASLKNQETVAEYVETKEDVEELRKIGVTYGQGYYLGKPRALSSWLEG